MSKQKKFTLFNIFIWILVVTFYFYEFFLRILPATIASDIIHTLEITVEQFAIISSGYYLAYSFMQIPVGILLDRFSERLLITIAVGLCSFGALGFSFSHGFISAFYGRLLIGIGSSFGFVALMIVTLNCFPKKYFAFLTGCGQFLGAMGPLCAGGPIALMLKAADGDWRIIFFWVAIFGIALTCLIGIFLQKKSKKQNTIVFVDKKDPLKKRLAALLSKIQIWWIFIYAGMVYVTLPLLGAFWGTSYLETRGLNKTSAAFLISMIWLGLAIGSPLTGHLSDVMKRRKPLMCLSAAIGVGSSLLFLFTPSINMYYLGFLFFLVGFAGSGQNLSFAIISEQSPKSLRATALGLNNTFLMGLAAIIPPFVTSIMRKFAVDGQLTEQAFEKGFLLIPIFFAIALLVSLFGIEETFCRQQNVVHRLRKA